VTAPRRWFFEDLLPGRTVETPAVTLTQAHVTRFLGLAGEWPDGPADKASAVPAILPLCLSTGLAWRVPDPPLAVLAFMGLEWRVLAPLYVGDTIRSRSTNVVTRSLREGGVLIESREILNQRDEVVQSGRLTLLVAKRPPGET
jgi:acyl dehydratase